MKCYSLTLGARHASGAGRRFAAADDTRVRLITRRHFPEGFTILHAQGGWFDPAARRFVAEESRQILVCATSRRRLRPWCRDLARGLKQKELLVVELGPAIRFRAGRSHSSKALRRS
jgi:hypothetical protein